MTGIWLGGMVEIWEHVDGDSLGMTHKGDSLGMTHKAATRA